MVVRTLVLGTLVRGRLVIQVVPGPRSLGPRGKTFLLSGVLAAWAAGLIIHSGLVGSRGVFSSQPVLLVALTVTFFLTEQYLVNIEFRRQTHSMTFAGVPLAIGILMVPIHELVLARLVGSLAALLLQRIASEKVIYNTCAFCFEAALTGSVVQSWLPPLTHLSPVQVLLLVVVIAAGDQLMSGLVLWVIRIHGGPLTRHDVAEVLVPSAVLSVVATVFGTAIEVLLRGGVLGSMLVVALLAFAIIVYRSYAATKRRHESLETVHGFVAMGVGAESVDELVHQCLGRIRQLLRASGAELILALPTPQEDQPDTVHVLDRRVLRFRVDEDDVITGTTEPLDVTDWLRTKALHHAEPTLVPASTKDGALQKWLAQQRISDALVVPLFDGLDAVGAVTVTDRLGDTATFTQDDLALLQTLISHLAVAVRSTRLVEQLSHDATHDSLTGLSNRAHLSSRIVESVESGADDIAVLLLDLDKFKEVNDVLGHDMGDRLLIVVADRLRQSLPATATIARLGGDEFAVLLTDLGHEACQAATLIAQRALDELIRPVRFDEAVLTPEASIGVAPKGTLRPKDLLRCADTAMYVAKASDAAIAVYHPDMDRGRAERLALVADLRLALDEHPEQFAVVYQPKIDLTSGNTVSAEALVRWNHPGLGVIGPDRFIPLAETSGLISRLTNHVLREALSACASWGRHGCDITVAVNLSPRNVADELLPERISEMLTVAGLEPQRLILEITESSVMEDPDRAVSVLNRLSNMGITVSLDDFGTGYSSLSYLQQLPVRELKIDRSFVLGLGQDNADNTRALIRSITALGENLGLRIVAEGIETPEQLQDVTAAGCHVGQGYLISRPLATTQMLRWIAEHNSSGRRLVGLGGPLVVAPLVVVA
jgi:diguanylate cyclase (GGDEF)-like protein